MFGENETKANNKYNRNNNNNNFKLINYTLSS